MSVFKEMDPLLCQKAIEGYDSVLDTEARHLDDLYKRFKCSRCKAPLRKEFDSRHAFSDSDSLVARALLRCETCNYLVDPHTNIVLDTGSPTKVPEEVMQGLGNS